MSEIVDTVETARRISLLKWRKVRTLSDDLFNEIETSCGFCNLGTYLSKTKGSKVPFVDKCDHCGVGDRCDQILEKVDSINSDLNRLIDQTLDFLKDLEEVKP